MLCLPYKYTGPFRFNLPMRSCTTQHLAPPRRLIWRYGLKRHTFSSLIRVSLSVTIQYGPCLVPTGKKEGIFFLATFFFRGRIQKNKNRYNGYFVLWLSLLDARHKYKYVYNTVWHAANDVRNDIRIVCRHPNELDTCHILHVLTCVVQLRDDQYWGEPLHWRQNSGMDDVLGHIWLYSNWRTLQR